MTRHHGHPHAQRLGNCLKRHATNRASTVSRTVANNAWITKGGLFPCVSHPQPFSRLTYRAHRVNRRPHETPKHLDTAVVMFESSSALEIATYAVSGCVRRASSIRATARSTLRRIATASFASHVAKLARAPAAVVGREWERRLYYVAWKRLRLQTRLNNSNLHRDKSTRTIQ